ncbi:MAG: hypothetical protein FWD53_00420, partial [Phycisphaerales bacterium]|nr:hypothetical protein [Phycisphaerales bacterium]
EIAATGSIGSLTVRGDIENSFITAASIGSLTVTGIFNRSWIDCRGTIKTLTLGSMLRSGVYSDSINKLTLTQLKNSSIIATAITSVKLPTNPAAIEDDGNLGTFGFLATVLSYSGPTSSGNYLAG